jgi:predicted dehydrogenase
VYYSLTDLLKDPIGRSMDGAIVCTPHSTHFSIGKELIEEGKRRYNEAKAASRGVSESELAYRPINVLMEKPMTTNVKEAKGLCDLLMDRHVEGSIDVEGERSESSRKLSVGGGVGCFLINHSANYRAQTKAAHSLIQSGKLGTIRHGKAYPPHW